MSALFASVRKPVMAGRFYPGDAATCKKEAAGFVRLGKQPAEAKRWLGGIVPHAGWICSGAIAGDTISAIARQNPKPDVVVVFGAVHTPLPLEGAALDTNSKWQVPSGESAICREAVGKLGELKLHFCTDEQFHRQEHAVEVELPLIQQAFGSVMVLPIEVAPGSAASAIGRETAKVLDGLGLKAVFLASSDLTHYGPDYRFTPAGIGSQALDWAMDNDRRLLALVERVEDEWIVPEVRKRNSACGAGAIAAMLSACKAMGASTGRIIRHTNSFETLFSVAPQPPTNAVGYVSAVVG